MDKPNNLPTKFMTLLALLQGLGLMVLHQSLKFEFWPDQSPQWLLPFYTFALIWPTTVLLSITHDNYKQVLKYSLSFALITSIVGYYIGYQALPRDFVNIESILFPYVLTLGIAAFKALMYLQQFTSGERFTYSALFKWSWRNFLTLGLAIVFAGGFWLILTLWAALFKAIGVSFFETLFERHWFFYPAIAIAHGFGIIIFRNLSHVIDTITRLQQALMKYLLIVLVLVSILFLSALPMTGLTPLWENGGSTLILWMQALMLFFINSVYQDDSHVRPYPIWVHRFIYIGVAILPIYSAISFYGLSLRIEQYGWSLSRCWAFLIWFLLMLFSLGYCWGIVKLKDNWVAQLSRVNVVNGLIVLAAMLLINTPLIDFRKISLDSQLNRLEAEKTSLENFDLRYLKRSLARPGYLALIDLKDTHSELNPKFGLRIIAVLENGRRGRDDKKSKITYETFVAAIESIGDPAPKLLLNRIFEQENENHWGIENTKAYYLYQIELNRDESPEYLLIRHKNYRSELTLFYLEGKVWMDLEIADPDALYEGHQLNEFINTLKKQGVSITKPKWDNFEVNGNVYKVR